MSNGNQEIARIDTARIQHAVSSFPMGSEWKVLRCLELLKQPEKGSQSKRSWKKLIEMRGGAVYAFLLPVDTFKKPRTILLHGRNQKNKPTKFPFEFIGRGIELESDQRMLAYVGKTTNFHQRVQWHFSLEEVNTGGEVQFGLCNSGVCASRLEAQTFMLKHGEVVYLALPGDSQIANRDLIEIGLIAKYHPPFNIKAEH